MRGVAAVLVLVATACTSTLVDDPSTTSVQMATTTTPAPIGWVEVAPMSIARSEHPGVVFNDEMVVAGGFIEVGVGRTGVTDTVEAYAPETDTWRDLPALPEPINHGMAAVVAGRLFFMGGYSVAGDAVNTVWELVDGQWVNRAPIPVPVGAGAAVELDGQIYLVGGVPHGSFYRYQMDTDTWEHLTDPSVQREHLAAVAIQGEIWALAGRWQGEIFDSTEIFDPVAASWRSGPSLNEARSGFGAAVIEGGIVVAGGEVFEPDEALSTVERFDIGSGEWSFIDPLPHGLHGNPLVVIGSDLYLPGGSTRAGDIENDGRSFRLSFE